MGEAKRRKAKAIQGFEGLDAYLRGLGIDTSQFGFYDQDAFTEAERKEPEFLENYAQWVALRPRDEAYNRHARDVVGCLSDRLAQSLKADAFDGGCVAAAGMMTRMLDRLGVWSFGVVGSIILEVESRDLWRGLQIADIPDFPGAALGHSWVGCAALQNRRCRDRDPTMAR
jgi:hypothetical protein